MTSDATSVAPPARDSRTFTALVMSMALVILLPTLSYRIGVDQAAFAHIGAEILEGRWPYISTWEGDYPGMMFLHAFEILIFGKSIAMFRVFDLLFQLGTVFFIFRITSRVGNRAGGLLAAGLYCLIYQGYGPWNTAQREGFATFFVLWGFWLYFTATRRPAWRSALGIGLGLGVAVMIKPTMLALGWFFLPLLPRLRKSNAKVPVMGAVGLLIPAVLVLAFYASIGGLRELYEATVSYQPIYTARLRGTDPIMVHWLESALKLGLQSVLVGVAYLPFLLIGDMRRERLMLYLAYLGAIAGVVVQGTFAGYHYLPGLAVGAVLIGSGFVMTVDWLQKRFDSGWIRSREVMLAGVAIVLLAPIFWRAESWRRLVTLQFLEPPAPGEFVSGTVFNFTESYDVAAYLQSHSRPSDLIQVWGYEPLVYYLSDRDEASRFQITHPLVMRVPGQPLSQMQERWRAEFMRDVRTRKPLYVAIVKDDNWWWAPQEQTSLELMDGFPEWKSFVSGNYELETTIGRFLVFRRKDRQETP